MKNLLKEKFTLLIPTYNRPLLLAKLLHYLTLEGADFPILVLDSSQPATVAQNKNFLEKSSLNISHVVYPPDITPFQKFAKGFALVQTPFSALTADDDVPILKTIEKSINFLLDHPEYNLAHGLYFCFSEFSNEIVVDRLVETHLPITDSSVITRIIQFVKHYSAITYAVYKTDVAKYAFNEAAHLSSTLANELLAGVLCLITGKVGLIPELYYGRNNTRFTQYFDSHPLEYLARSAENLFLDYSQYRQVIFKALKIHHPTLNLGNPKIRNQIDLVHLSYLLQYLNPKIIHFTLEKLINNEVIDEKFFNKMWECYYESNQGLFGKLKLKLSRLVNSLQNRFLPSTTVINLKRHLFGMLKRDKLIKSQLGSLTRQYRFTNKMLSHFSNLNEEVQLKTAALIQTLEHYT